MSGGLRVKQGSSLLEPAGSRGSRQSNPVPVGAGGAFQARASFDWLRMSDVGIRMNLTPSPSLRAPQHGEEINADD